MYLRIFITVIFLYCQLYKFLKVILILLYKILMLLHSLLKNDKELFNRVVVKTVKRKKSKLYINFSVYVD